MDDVSQHRFIIEAGRTEKGYWRDLWVFRELVYFLSLRDILVRYKQTAIGVAWSVLRPLLTMVALTLVFSRAAGLQTGDPTIPYSLWVFVAMLPWQFFADGLAASSNSLVGNSNMVTKVYFPRVILPISRVMVSFVDFAVSAGLLAMMMVFYHFYKFHFTPSWEIVFIPIFLLLTFASAIGVGMWFASLNVKYRDFVYIVPFVVQFGLYVSPVGISSADMTHGKPMLRAIYSLNPIVGVIDGFRWCVFGDRAPLFWPGQLISLGVIALLLFLGVRHFRKFERSFADLI